MLTKTETLPHSRIKLEATATAEQFRKTFLEELAAVAANTQMPGFRKGKAPMEKVLERVGRERVEAGVLDRLATNLYYDSIQEAKVVPVGTPSIDIVKFAVPGEDAKEGDETLSVTIEVDVLPEVKVDAYKKLKLKVEAPEAVTDADVDTVISYLQKQRGSLGETTEDTVAENGMWIDIMFDGSVDGVKRPDMHSEHHPLVIGENTLIPGFEEELVGMKVGEEKTFPITFPKDYHATELAGKKAEFSVKVHKLKVVNIPEVDADFAEGFGHDTADALKAAIKENLEEEKAQQARGKQEQDVIDQLIKLIPVEAPETLIERESDRLFVEGKKQLSQLPGQWEQYLQRTGKSETAIKEEVREQAEKNVQLGVILGAIAKEEGIAESETTGSQVLNMLVEQATTK